MSSSAFDMCPILLYSNIVSSQCNYLELPPLPDGRSAMCNQRLEGAKLHRDRMGVDARFQTVSQWSYAQSSDFYQFLPSHIL